MSIDGSKSLIIQKKLVPLEGRGLLESQRDHGIDIALTVGRHIAGQQRHEREEARHCHPRLVPKPSSVQNRQLLAGR